MATTGPPLSKDQLELIFQLRARGTPKTTVAKQVNCGVTTVRNHEISPAGKRRINAIKRELKENPNLPPPEGTVAETAATTVAGDTENSADPVKDAQERLSSRAFRSRERGLVDQMAKERNIQLWLRELLEDFVQPMPAPPIYHAPIVTGASEETMLFFFSDWHAYEIVKRERVQGLNEYNAVRFTHRAERSVRAGISIKTRMEAGGGWIFPNAVVACNGDFISGTIHEVEKHSDAPNVIMAMYGCGMTLAAAIRDIAANFEHVTVVCTSGNHGRLPDHRKVHSKEPTRNWDTAIYLIAELALKDVPNVTFIIPDSYICSFTIGRKRFVQYHGHSIKSWNSIPHYGISRWTRNTQAMRSQTNEQIDYFLISHFHSESSLPASAGARTIINGSLIGGTEYTVEQLGVADPPTQVMLAVSDPIGVNSSWPLFGEKPGESIDYKWPVYPWERNNT